MLLGIPASHIRVSWFKFQLLCFKFLLLANVHCGEQTGDCTSICVPAAHLEVLATPSGPLSSIWPSSDHGGHLQSKPRRYEEISLFLSNVIIKLF